MCLTNSCADALKCTLHGIPVGNIIHMKCNRLHDYINLTKSGNRKTSEKFSRGMPNGAYSTINSRVNN